MHLRVVGTYQPNPKGEGENTVYMQHQRCLLKQKEPWDSELAFDQDLQKAIKTWSEAGDHIVIVLDANNDLHNGAVKLLIFPVRPSVHPTVCPSIRVRSRRLQMRMPRMVPAPMD
jgi:hypothetical protein